MIEIPTCPVCGGREFKKLFVKRGRHFWRCLVCKLEKQHPFPTPGELTEYYDASYSSGLYRTFADAGGMKAATARMRLESIRSRVCRGRWLDVGCSNGTFVAAAVRDGAECEGIDLSSVAVGEGRSRGLPLYCSDVENWRPYRPYDTITCFDVLEHVLDPVRFLVRIRELLVPSGSLVITVPDLSSWTKKLMGHRWYFYIPEEHLHYFHPSTLRRLLSRLGFETRQCSRTLQAPDLRVLADPVPRVQSRDFQGPFDGAEGRS